MPRPLRLFIAVDLPGETVTVARRIITRVRNTGIDGRWTDPEHLHITLWFLGDVMAGDIPALCAAMDRVGAASAPLELSIGGVGGFPDASPPRTVWLGVQDGAVELTAIHDALAAELEPLGFPPEERRYTPHVTLGRLRQGSAGTTALLAAEMARLVDARAGSGGVESLTLLASVTGRDGPRYDVVHVADLGP